MQGIYCSKAEFTFDYIWLLLWWWWWWYCWPGVFSITPDLIRCIQRWRHRYLQLQTIKIKESLSQTFWSVSYYLIVSGLYCLSCVINASESTNSTTIIMRSSWASPYLSLRAETTRIRQNFKCKKTLKDSNFVELI